MSLSAFGQNYKVIKINELMKIMEAQNDTALILNFWASWCKPCVAELPHFDELNVKFPDKPFKVLFVSLDFVKTADQRIPKLLKEKSIHSPVYLLNEPDYNSWIDKIDSAWGGSLPATLVLDTKKKKAGFYEKELSKEELEIIVDKLIH
jgi:thiol-disulfide isomerase/thioredoxin